MKKIILLFAFLTAVASCKNTEKKEPEKQLTAGEIIDKSIAVSGGGSFAKTRISFDFRGVTYISEGNSWRNHMERIKTDSVNTTRDVLHNGDFTRYVNEKLTKVADSMTSRYANSINSVHYFAYLPYGLNSKAVNAALLDEATVKEKDYYKIKVTFDQEGGGDDFEDVYLYWIDKTSFTMDYLAYEFHVNGGGMRFREAYNIRTVGGIRFADYNNFKPSDEATTLYDLDSLFGEDKLELLSKIELENISATPCDTC